MTNILLRRRKLGNGSCRGIQTASRTGLQVLRNDANPPSNLMYIFRWGCTSALSGHTRLDGSQIINTSQSIHWCSDKRQGRLDMQEAGVSVPKTYGTYQELGHDYWEGPLPESVKVVLRPSRHAQGRNLDVYGRDEEENLIAKCRAYGNGSYYISKLINKVAEYRVMLVQNRVAWVAQKTPGNPEDVAWNVARGGRFDNVRWDNWPMAVIKEALAAAKVSGCDFCGVDVMVDAEGKAYVLEVNSAPSQTSPYRQQCVAKAFDHIVTNGKDHFPDPSRFRSYKDVIHPAVRGPVDA